MNPETTPVVTFAALSGTGKTTFLESLIPVLKARGLRVAVIKHDAHRFEMDKPGKDTYRFSAAGADVVAIANREKLAMIEHLTAELSLEELLERLPEVDLVLTEGYKRSRYPKIALHRAALGRPLLETEGPLLAVVTDEPLEVSVPQLPLDDPGPCAELVLRYAAAFRAEAAGNS